MSPAGAALILCACLTAAGLLTCEQRQKLNALRDLSAALERLQAELSLRATGLPEISATFAKECRGAAARFFRALCEEMADLGERPFSAIWEGAARSALPELRGEELDVFCRLGETLGRYELQSQLAAIELCRSSLERDAALLADALPERRRLAFGLLGAAGALLCIILM